MFHFIGPDARVPRRHAVDPHFRRWFDITRLHVLFGAPAAGVVEEAGKLLGRGVRGPEGRKGIHSQWLPLYGAAIGAGFAAFESTGYAFTTLWTTRNVRCDGDLDFLSAECWRRSDMSHGRPSQLVLFGVRAHDTFDLARTHRSLVSANTRPRHGPPRNVEFRRRSRWNGGSGRSCRRGGRDVAPRVRRDPAGLKQSQKNRHRRRMAP